MDLNAAGCRDEAQKKGRSLSEYRQLRVLFMRSILLGSPATMGIVSGGKAWELHRGRASLLGPAKARRLRKRAVSANVCPLVKDWDFARGGHAGWVQKTPISMG